MGWVRLRQRVARSARSVAKERKGSPSALCFEWPLALPAQGAELGDRGLPGSFGSLFVLVHEKPRGEAVDHVPFE